MDSFYAARKQQLDPEPEADGGREALMEFLETAWKEPDEGIWEVRGPRRHFTHSKMMAWVAADRAVKLSEKFGTQGPVERWKKLRDEIRADVLARGFNPRRNAFVQDYGSDLLDASLLMMPLIGFLPATDPRVMSTVAAIERDLISDGLVKRYQSRPEVDGLPPGEGTFLACTFWYADNLALMGRYDEAREVFERLLSLRNDVGLLAEEYDTIEQAPGGKFSAGVFACVADQHRAQSIALERAREDSRELRNVR